MASLFQFFTYIKHFTKKHNKICIAFFLTKIVVSNERIFKTDQKDSSFVILKKNKPFSIFNISDIPTP